MCIRLRELFLHPSHLQKLLPRLQSFISFKSLEAKSNALYRFCFGNHFYIGIKHQKQGYLSEFNAFNAFYSSETIVVYNVSGIFSFPWLT